MSDKMDLSLDDIINQNREVYQYVGASGNARGTMGRGGKLTKKRTRAVNQRAPYPRPKINPSKREYESTSKKASNDSSPNETHILVSNLESGVIDEDIKELFGDIGPFKKASVHYDKQGLSLGTADVIFEQRADAIKAIKLYNGVPLDGQPMYIEIAYSTTAPTDIKSRLGNFRSADSQQYLNGGRKWHGASVSGRSRVENSAKVLPTAEELDAELEEYIKNKTTT